MKILDLPVTCFDDEDRNIGVLSQAASDDTSGSATTDDDEVEVLRQVVDSRHVV